MDWLREISARILRIRREKGMTQEQLAELVDKSQAWISRLERGDEKISIEMLYLIADALSCSIYEFLPDNRK